MEENEQLLAKIQKEPNDNDKYLFLSNHRNYILKCLYSKQPWLFNEVKEDLASDILLKLYQVKENIDWTLNYPKIKGYIATVTNNWLVLVHRKENSLYRIPEKSLVELNDWNDIMQNDDKDLEDMKDKQLQLILDCLKRANESEKRIITGLLKGLNYKDLGITRQAVSKCLKRFSKRILNSDKSIKL